MGTREGPLRTRCVRRGRGSSVSVVRSRKHVRPTAYTVLSLFSGGGGLDLGLHLTDRFRHVGCVEMDPAACRTLRVNRDAGRFGDGDLAVHEADISKLDPIQVLAEHGHRPGELDVIVGGPPCQAFSQIGKQLGLDDPRGLLLWDYVRFVRVCRPRCFLLENVKGLLAMPLRPGMQKGTLMRSLLGRFRRAGYRVDVFLLDAADYGVPQHRERVILVGNRHGLNARPPARTHGPGLLPYRTLRDALAGLEEANPVRLDFSAAEKAVLRLVPIGGDWRDLPVRVAMRVLGPDCRPRGRGRCRGYRRLCWDLPSPTVLTGPNRGVASLCHPDEDRTLTLRECARLQGWPDEWQFCGSKTQQYRQVGNGVPVPLAYVLGHAVANLLDDIDQARQGCSSQSTPARRGRVKVRVA